MQWQIVHTLAYSICSTCCEFWNCFDDLSFCLLLHSASIDGETDAFVQRMLRTRFRNVTLVTIAHRLLTIMDYDLILVMDAGKAAEIGSPLELLSRNGIFADLVNATGAESAKALRAMAEAASHDQ